MQKLHTRTVTFRTRVTAETDRLFRAEARRKRVLLAEIQREALENHRQVIANRQFNAAKNKAATKRKAVA
jgi:hypothetical protein